MTAMQRMLVVDDEPDVAVGFRRVFERDGFEIDSAVSGEEALTKISEQRPDLVLMDLRMPGLNGIETLKKIQAISPRQLVILMTAYSTSANVIEAMKHGAYDFLIKPFSVEKLREIVHEAMDLAREMHSVTDVQPAATEDHPQDTIIGKSEAMQEVYKMVGQVAHSNATVLVTGESGTGKELVARAIHRHSERPNKPFIAVNCAAIPETLLESELFGHEKGSFTSAVSRRHGKFEQADNGTLFLDEIGDMSLATQTKILRVLQSGEFERIGGSETLLVDVRIIAATNRNLEEMMEDGRFRPDLFYRLNVVRVQMPPLRRRRDDIPNLVDYFLRMYLRDRPDKKIRMSSAAIEKMTNYDWPGNVRELENTLRNAVLTVKTDTILPIDVRLKSESEPRPIEHQASGSKPVPQGVGKGLTREEIDLERAVNGTSVFEDIERQVEPMFDKLVEARSRGDNFSAFDVIERAMLIHALNKTSGNQLRAAKLLGITRSTLRKRIAKYEIEISTTARGAR